MYKPFTSISSNSKKNHEEKNVFGLILRELDSVDWLFKDLQLGVQLDLELEKSGRKEKHSVR